MMLAFLCWNREGGENAYQPMKISYEDGNLRWICSREGRRDRSSMRQALECRSRVFTRSVSWRVSSMEHGQSKMEQVYDGI